MSPSRRLIGTRVRYYSGMESAVYPIGKLWMNGRAVGQEGGRLEVDPATRRWRLLVHLPEHSPFRQQFGLSLQLTDGRTAHGRARLVEAEGDYVVFEGCEGLDGSV